MKLNKNKFFAIYILWIFLNFILFITSGNFLFKYRYDFYPFPIFYSSQNETYLFGVYNKLINSNKIEGLPEFDKFADILKDKERVINFYSELNKVPYNLIDTTNFVSNIYEAANHEKNKKYNKHYHFFETRLYYYDYSEFLIYLFLPLVLYYVIKLWNSK